MTAKVHALPPREPFRVEQQLPSSLARSEDRRLLGIALSVAVLVHVVFLLVNLPNVRQAQSAPKQDESPRIERDWWIPPPRIERRPVARSDTTRKVPVPDQNPDDLEPMVEPAPVFEPVPVVSDGDLLMAPPVEATPSGPLLPDVDGVTRPILTHKVQPEYPELARVAGLEGNVILRAIVLRDGSVGEIEVLRCSRPRFGFEQAAIDAVTQWLYDPATQDGRPVEVYFTIYVNFSLH